MSHVYADWLTRPERIQEEQPDRLVKTLRIPVGGTIVDLGAGVGYFSWRLAKAVGPEGRVIATDIQSEMLEMLELNMRRRGLSNVETVLATHTDPRLPPNAVDLVLLVDVYHELSQPLITMRKVRESLNPDGRVVLVEYRKEDPWIPIQPLHKMSETEVRREIGAAGFEFIETLDFLPWQHVVIFGRGSD